ncbi:MAG TPA: 2'-5' RNA ligase family protein [Pseudonocardiaceae bacterium]|nr:2'-5' RNA ligase family protein [Pseudonocardiaceae bacterium]
MPQQGQTAVIMPVPAADPILAAVAAEYPDAVRPGIPAHVSLLYPFLPAEALDAEVSDWLSDLATRTPPLAPRFTELVVEPGFAHLSVPEFGPLTSAIRARWPEVVPYGGRFGPTPVAHLTIAMGFAPADADRITALTRPFLPLSVTVDELWLLALTSGWQRLGRFPFSGSRGAD